MILGRDRHAASACFDEYDAAVRAIDRDAGRNRVVCFNAHLYAPPDGAIVYNMEDVLVPSHDGSMVVTDHATMWAGHEVWDPFPSHKGKHGFTHVPFGYHPSMERFSRVSPPAQDIDVLFVGCLNPRRRAVLDGLKTRGLNVVYRQGCYGEERDALLARSKLALQMQYNPVGEWGQLRVLHCIANRVPVLSETHPSAAWGVKQCAYESLVDEAEFMVRGATHQYRAALAEVSYRALRAQPMVLPDEGRGAWLKRIAESVADPWDILRRTTANEWDIEAMYTAHRKEPLAEGPRVLMIVPSYRESIEIQQRTDPAREAVQADLSAHGIGSGRASIYGDSLVARMRQRGVNQFMKSKATHLLWCDLDIEPLDPACVRKMLATGHDVIAGACPFKNTDRRVVCNLMPGAVEAMQETGKLEAPGGCIEVQDAGTGFMLVSRKAIVALMKAHPELLHWSGGKSDHGEPLWAIYDTGVVDGVYRSEDYMFCHLWRQLGGKVYVHLESTFRHYGTHGFEASIMEQLGLREASP